MSALETGQVFSTETGQMSTVETRQMSSVETGPMPAVETGHMSAVETGKMSSVKTVQMPAVKTGQMPAVQMRGPAPNHKNCPDRFENFGQDSRICPNESRGHSAAFGTGRKELPVRGLAQGSRLSLLTAMKPNLEGSKLFVK